MILFFFLQIDKAEAVLLEIRKSLEKGGDNQHWTELSDKFYAELPHTNKQKMTIKTIRDIARKQDLCQVCFSWGSGSSWLALRFNVIFYISETKNKNN